VSNLGNLVEGVVTSGVELEEIPDKGCSLRIGVNGSGDPVVQVPDRSVSRPDALGDFASVTAADVLGEVVHIVLALPEEDREHELARRCRVEWAGRESEILDGTLVNQVDDPSAVQSVSSQSIRVPSQDATGFTTLDPREHGVEDGPTGSLRGLALNERVDYREGFTASEITEFRDLVVNRPYLVRGVVGGLPGVKDVLGSLHGAKNCTAKSCWREVRGVQNPIRRARLRAGVVLRVIGSCMKSKEAFEQAVKSLAKEFGPCLIVGATLGDPRGSELTVDGHTSLSTGTRGALREEEGLLLAAHAQNQLRLHVQQLADMMQKGTDHVQKRIDQVADMLDFKTHE